MKFNIDDTVFEKEYTDVMQKLEDEVSFPEKIDTIKKSSQDTDIYDLSSFCNLPLIATGLTGKMY